MVIYMSISWLKASSDRKSFKIFESFGMDVYKINDLEKTDEKNKRTSRQKLYNYCSFERSSKFFRRYYKKIQQNRKRKYNYCTRS